MNLEGFSYIFNKQNKNRPIRTGDTACQRCATSLRWAITSRDVKGLLPVTISLVILYNYDAILRAIGRRLVEVTGEPREVSWFGQNLVIAIYSEAMPSVFSQPVGRGFRGSGESRSTQPLTLFLREFPLP